MACNNCDNNNTPHPYRVVQTIHERDTLPCIERLNGMLVTVVGEDLSYKQYILKGGDPCVNSNWEEFNISEESLTVSIGHETVATIPENRITSSQLNTQFPEALEGFRVTYSALNTTFMKVAGDVWVMTNNFPIDYE